ncbi:MAG: putative nickel insertion protein [Dehalococcoidia bacterium]|nr:putative nickel insertion protein [Dehalococcoidia bacterium]
MKIGYFHAIGGAAGDMIMGAMVDAGLSLEALKAELSKLHVTGYTISAQPVRRGHIKGTLINVDVVEAYPGLRSLNGLLKLVKASSFPDNIKARGEAIFRRLAQAEGKVHGVAPDKVRFHELGVVDTVIDVMGAVIGMELLELSAVYCSPLPAGSGTIMTEHGTYHLPAPATLELMAMAGAPLRGETKEVRGERPEVGAGSHLPPPPSHFSFEQTTPTGAAILTTLAKFEQPSLYVKQIGYGAGSKDTARIPNVLALWVGETNAPHVGAQHAAPLQVIETNIDNMSPEISGYVMEKLLEMGALDVWFTPIQMKKNRPAITLSVLYPAELESSVVEILFRETTTLGLRVQPVRRVETGREVVEFASSLGKVKVKLKYWNGKAISLAPEYDDCRRLAEEKGLPLAEVYRVVSQEAGEKLLH